MRYHNYNPYLGGEHGELIVQRSLGQFSISPMQQIPLVSQQPTPQQQPAPVASAGMSLLQPKIGPHFTTSSSTTALFAPSGIQPAPVPPVPAQQPPPQEPRILSVRTPGQIYDPKLYDTMDEGPETIPADAMTPQYDQPCFMSGKLNMNSPGCREAIQKNVTPVYKLPPQQPYPQGIENDHEFKAMLPSLVTFFTQNYQCFFNGGGQPIPQPASAECAAMWGFLHSQDNTGFNVPLDKHLAILQLIRPYLPPSQQIAPPTYTPPPAPPSQALTTTPPISPPLVTTPPPTTDYTMYYVLGGLALLGLGIGGYLYFRSSAE